MDPEIIDFIMQIQVHFVFFCIGVGAGAYLMKVMIHPDDKFLRQLIRDTIIFPFKVYLVALYALRRLLWRRRYESTAKDYALNTFFPNRRIREQDALLEDIPESIYHERGWCDEAKPQEKYLVTQPITGESHIVEPLPHEYYRNSKGQPCAPWDKDSNYGKEEEKLQLPQMVILPTPDIDPTIR